jgi:hypothetical protein
MTNRPGWPDEFVKKVSKNFAQPFFVKINNTYVAGTVEQVAQQCALLV